MFFREETDHSLPIYKMYGNAALHTASTWQLDHVFHPRGSSHIPLGWNYAGAWHGMVWDPCHDPGHYLGIGSTRSGKNTDVITPMLMTYYGSMLVLDPKGENAFLTMSRRKQLGHRVVLLDPWNEVSERYGSKVGLRAKRSRFNPLAHLNARSPDFAEDVTAIADAVIVQHAGGGDPHWTDSARELVAGLIAAIVEKSPRVASFADVRRLLVADDETLAAEIAAICKANPDSLAGRKLRRFAKDGREVASIRSTAVTNTAILDSVRLLDSMSTERNAFDLAELATSLTTIYLVLPVDRLETYGRWMRLLLSQAIKAVARQRTPPNPPVVFLLDELGTISPKSGLQMVAQAMGLMAGMGIRIAAFFQDLKQLQTDYPQQWETFIANAAVIQLLRVNDMTTAKYFSEYMGTYTHVTTHYMNNEIQNQTAQGRPVLYPQEITGLGSDETLILKSGGHNYRLHKVSYFKDPRWKPFYRHNPLFPRPPEPPPPPPPPVPFWVKIRARYRRVRAWVQKTYAGGQAWASTRTAEARRKRSDRARENTSTTDRARMAKMIRDAR